MRKEKLKQKDLIIPFCEGEAEINVFNFLKIVYSNKKIRFGKPQDLEGIKDFAEFKRKYNKLSRANSLKPKKDYSHVNFLFIIDNDLDDSNKIKDFILEKGHLIQLCDPNTEGMILSIVGKKQICSTDKKTFRKKCKVNFEGHFNCEAHKLKDSKLREIFNNAQIVQTNLLVLHDLFIK
jgi:hypothetical protein